jgi:hypothetical protein
MIIEVANSSQQHPNIRGVDLNWAGGTGSDRSSIYGGEIVLENFTFQGDTSLTGSTGVYLNAHRCNITTKITGQDGREGETGVHVTAGRQGGEYHIDASGGGFGDANDEVVYFAATDMTGMLWYITYDPGEIPLRINSSWSSSNKIYYRTSIAQAWTELTAGTAFNWP